jgi:uncharacterized protein (TIGR03435 family)
MTAAKITSLFVLLFLSELFAQSPATFPKFEVVSVRPCNSNTIARGGERGANIGTASPARLQIECQTVFDLIHTAYVTFANGRVNAPWTVPADPPFSSMADWLLTERFTIEATTAEAVPVAMIRGPMLQAALEDRFKLKVHRESREAPIYEMVVRKGGHKLTPFQPGMCVPYDWSSVSQPPLDSGQHRCAGVTERDHDNNWLLTVEGATLDEIAENFRFDPDRPVVNKTGITGLFSFRLVYKGYETSGAPPFMDAIQDQLGLEFRPAKGLRDFLVIDHVERPTPN